MKIALPANKLRFALLSLIFISPLVFFLLQFPTSFGGDSSSYSQYATNLLAGRGYSILVEGIPTSNFREPVYPFLLAGLYAAFGVENLFPVVVVQSVMLGAAALLVAFLFIRLGKNNLGYLAGFAVALLPSYGLYAHTIGTELPFMFVLMLLFALSVLIAERKEATSWKMWLLLGLLCGIGTLLRSQMLFFLPFLLCAYAAYTAFKHMPRLLLGAAVALAAFIVVVGSWSAYLHAETGSFSLTGIRPEMALYIRAHRAELSYRDLTQYAHDWVVRSLSGGAETKLLGANEYHTLQLEYRDTVLLAGKVEEVKKENIATILAHPGQYAYGNLIEVVKLAYIEHDYSDFLNKYVRALEYVFIYGFFLMGVALLCIKKGNKEERILALLSIVFIAYNFLVLTPFDTIPRYNTPYLAFYLIVGFVGLSLLLRVRQLPTYFIKR